MWCSIITLNLNAHVVVVSPDVAVHDTMSSKINPSGLNHLEVVVVVVAVVVEGIEAVVQLVVLIPCEILKKKCGVVL